MRDVCCLTMQFIGENFLTFNANLPPEQQELVRVLRGNLSMGWTEDMTAPVKHIAEVEKQLVSFMFTDVFNFIKLLVSAMLDEPSNAEPLGKLAVKLNNVLPFCMMNDYRISVATNSLRRVELLRLVLTKDSI